MVEIFRTDVEDEISATELMDFILSNNPSLHISLDLEDCDKILRVSGEFLEPVVLMNMVRSAGYACEMLEDD